MQKVLVDSFSQNLFWWLREYWHWDKALGSRRRFVLLNDLELQRVICYISPVVWIPLPLQSFQRFFQHRRCVQKVYFRRKLHGQLHFFDVRVTECQHSCPEMLSENRHILSVVLH